MTRFKIVPGVLANAGLESPRSFIYLASSFIYCLSIFPGVPLRVVLVVGSVGVLCDFNDVLMSWHGRELRVENSLS